MIKRDDPSDLQPNTNISTPEINGSPVGFLALVISLSIFVVLCCVAIFWLLAYHQPTEEERARRKAESNAAKASAKPQSPNPGGWKARIGQLFGRKGQWVQAADEEYESTTVWRGGEQELRDRGVFGGGGRGGEHGVVSSSRAGLVDRSLSQSSSTSTVELSARSSSTTPGAVHFPTYDEPFGGGVVSPGPSISSPTSSHEHLHGRVRSMSAEVGYDDESLEGDGSLVDNRHFSVQSFNPDVGHIPMRKWDNGTKFQEVIQ